MLQKMMAKTISVTAIANTTISAVTLTRRTSLILTHLLFALAVTAAFAPYATHVFGDRFGEFFGHQWAP
jgi:hypothetical protein